MKTLLTSLLFALQVGCSTSGPYQRPVPPQASASEMEELAESLERLSEAVHDALDRLGRASIPISVDLQALEEVERILGQTLGELRGEVSTAVFRPLTTRQKLERLQVAADGLLEALVADIRRAETGADAAAEATDSVEGERAAAVRGPIPEHLRGVMAEGERIFSRTCALCHGVRGQGLTAPALDGARRLSDPGFAVTMILWGVPDHGMPAFHDQLSDEQVAAVATYARNAWSNDFGPVAREAVTRARSR